MKKFMNLSKFAIAALVTSGLFVACSEEISENTADTQYTAQTGNISNAGQAVDLGLPSGTLWANKNVGASSESDNGILFIWGDITGKKIDADKDTRHQRTESQNPLIPTSHIQNKANNGKEKGIPQTGLSHGP